MKKGMTQRFAAFIFVCYLVSIQGWRILPTGTQGARRGGVFTR